MKTYTGILKHRSALLKPVKFAALLMLLFVAAAQAQREPTPTEAIVACYANATQALVECTDALPWYSEGLCGIKWEADIVLCTLLGGLPT